MSALSILPFRDRLYIFADTAACSKDGLLRERASKIRIVDNFAICITCGMGTL